MSIEGKTQQIHGKRTTVVLCSLSNLLTKSHVKLIPC